MKELVEKRKAAVEDLMKREPGLTNVEMGKRLGINERTVRKYKAKLKADTQMSSDVITSNRYKTAYNSLKKKYNNLIKLLDNKDIELANYIELAGCKKTQAIPLNTEGQREVVPVIVASDWHIEETVTAAITNGLNEYNLNIAEDSIKQFFNNAYTLINQTKRDSKIRTVVLAVLGDIINGVLRDEDLENNQTTPLDAVSIARSYLYTGIKLLAKETGCMIKVICCVGNHGRLTEKIRYSSQIHNSLEYLMYKTLERDFRDHPSVDFLVAEAPYVIQSIFGVRVRFQHGHSIRYHGGIGGLAVPVLRNVAHMNTIEKADLDVMGHFHSFQALNNVIINGSLVGTNGYSMALGLPHEPPQQTFFLIDSKYGKSMITPIFIDRHIDRPSTGFIERDKTI